MENNKQTGPATSKWNFNGLKALFINCTLKRSPQLSNTEGLMRTSMDIMRKAGLKVDYIRSVDHPIATGMKPDMTEAGWGQDAWPEIFERVMDADILVIGTPIWLGDKSSECTKVIERLYSESGKLNDKGQYIYYGKTGGCIITGNEDGIKHCSMNILFSLEHIGFVIPPQAETGWVGEAGPGPSYLDEESGGPENDFTKRSTTFMTWNLMHMARMLRDEGGFPAYGNQQDQWKKGETFGHPDAIRSRKLGRKEK